MKAIEVSEGRAVCYDESNSSVIAFERVNVTPQENNQQDRSFVNLLDGSSSMIEEKNHNPHRNLGPKGLRLFIEQKMSKQS